MRVNVFLCFIIVSALSTRHAGAMECDFPKDDTVESISTSGEGSTISKITGLNQSFELPQIVIAGAETLSEQQLMECYLSDNIKTLDLSKLSGDVLNSENIKPIANFINKHEVQHLILASQINLEQPSNDLIKYIVGIGFACKKNLKTITFVEEKAVRGVWGNILADVVGWLPTYLPAILKFMNDNKQQKVTLYVQEVLQEKANKKNEKSKKRKMLIVHSESTLTSKKVTIICSIASAIATIAFTYGFPELLRYVAGGDSSESFSSSC